MKPSTSPEYELFQTINHWQPINKIIPLSQLLPLAETRPEDSSRQLFIYLYQKVKKEYIHFPRRRNGKNAFIHPLNIVVYIQKAKIYDYLTYCGGLLHDLIEEKVDLQKKKLLQRMKKITMKQLEELEQQAFVALQQELQQFAAENKIEAEKLSTLLAVVKLLTNHKRHDYYHYIITMFTFPHESVRRRSIQVKLADRIHNVLSLEEFSDRDKIYQCFKNIFILNNAKEYLLARKEFTGLMSLTKEATPTEKLFKKCAKATYDALLTIAHQNLHTGIQRAEPIIQLAFEKYAFQTKGLWDVTDFNPLEYHPLRLFQGIIRKYDCRLHHHWEEFDQRTRQELEYCRKFFWDFQYTSKQLQAVVNYKDAFALAEVVIRLLYQKDYVLGKFSSSELFQ